MTVPAISPATSRSEWERLWLELTRRCQLACRHCYNASGPHRLAGTMTSADWHRVIDQAADLGVRELCVIGGEPTLYPGLATLINRAVGAGIGVEVYSNLVHISDDLWRVLAQDGVRLATSWYSDDQQQHIAITGRPTWRQTRANIDRALELGVPLRVGIVRVLDGQRIDQARAQLRHMGVATVSVDRTRRIGRAAEAGVGPLGELCGRCGDGRAAIGPDGEVWLCTMARTISAGNVRARDLADVLSGQAWRELRTTLPHRNTDAVECKPNGDSNDCAPAEKQSCDPSFCNPDD
ncbi:radical SAM/SPASM domain-containing protein [Actinomadura logoneensis]|uniref:Radical SAM/SPASM domain-containing protein n=1 Tax=Actinomadura logoneensis TaxID=2293572 RepID=A0A372JRE4_9ACTN|nr:radical SAM/SPASM domain-containing protein [Actinomadura logoneensis]RFU41928.1 radical SAM/SPASM domain-containing protein [Actinomadura logoneensis]